MPFVAVVQTNGNRVTKHAKFATLAEAQAHVAKHGGFATDIPPGSSWPNWRVDGQTITEDILPPIPRKIPPALNDTPASANSVPALRDELNELKAFLRGE